MKSIFNTLQKAQRRRILIAAGKKIIQSKTLNSLNVVDIIVESGMAHGTFYNYFKNKDSFVSTLVQEITLPFRISVSEARKLATNSEDYARFSYQSLVDLIETDPAIAKILATNRHEFSKYFFTPAVYDPIYEDVFEDVIKGCESGLFHKKILDCIEPFVEFAILLALDIMFKAAIHPQDPDYIHNEIEFASKILGEFDAP